jgi:hypothetical protein
MRPFFNFNIPAPSKFIPVEIFHKRQKYYMYPVALSDRHIMPFDSKNESLIV